MFFYYSHAFLPFLGIAIVFSPIIVLCLFCTKTDKQIAESRQRKADKLERYRQRPLPVKAMPRKRIEPTF